MKPRYWFASDLHFGHKMIWQKYRSQFPDREAMDEFIVDIWNAHVTPEDFGFLLGDISFRGQVATRHLLSRMLGRLHLIRGNHDKSLSATTLERFEWVKDLYRLKLPVLAGEGYQRIVLCHYPLRSWEGMHQGVWHLHGHSHGTLTDIGGRILDVGLDARAMLPTSYEEVATLMGLRTFTPVDHHTVNQGGDL